MNNIDIDYHDYINAHCSNIKEAYEWFKKKLPDVVNKCENLEHNIKLHDDSKFSDDEFDAYANYFYGESKNKNVKNAFDNAWLHHIHNNPHHWEYWLLLTDNKKIKPLDMPLDYIVEMICDWWTFGFKDGNLNEIFTFYANEKHKMVLSNQTRKTIEDILNKIQKLI